MKIISLKNRVELEFFVANILVKQVKEYPNSVLGLATGRTMLGIYEKILEINQNEKIDFSNVKTFNLDEYCGLASDDPQSYHYYMHHNLFNHINIKKENVHVPNGASENLNDEIKNYEMRIKECGGIDLQLLGIGLNGHIGFNEPGTAFDSRTHIVELHEATRKQNQQFFNGEDNVPKYAITMGIGSILEAKKIVLVATGEEKREILKSAINGEVNQLISASVLQLHNNVTVITDIANLDV